MSNVREKTRTELAEEDLVIASRLSEERVESFRQNYLHDREQAATIEKLFSMAGTARREPAWRDEYAFGFHAFLQKGPFVKGSNWLAYTTWDFAVAIEKRLLLLFERLLSSSPTIDLQSQTIDPTWPSVLDAIDDVHGPQYLNEVIVVSGKLSRDWNAHLEGRITYRSEMSERLRPLGAPWIAGEYRDRPILQIRDGTSSSLYLVRLDRFGTYVKYGTAAEFTAREITDDRADKYLTENPQIIPDASGAITREEKVRQLKLLVELRLFESATLEVASTTAGKRIQMNPVAESDGR